MSETTTGGTSVYGYEWINHLWRQCIWEAQQFYKNHAEPTATGDTEYSTAIIRLARKSFEHRMGR